MRGGRLEELMKIVARLRSPQGCPWDREQTVETVIGFLQEELDEVTEAARDSDPEHLCEELGDLLFNLVFVVHLADEKGWFAMRDVISSAAEKLIRRHPHVFGDENASSSEDVLEIWNRIKREEREQ